MIFAYADETGDPCDPRKHIFGIAGFIGRIEDWKAFASKWRTVCPSEFYPLHMTEFVNRTIGDDSRQRSVLGPLVEILRECSLVPISVACDVHEFREPGTDLTEPQAAKIYEWLLNRFFCQVGIAVLGARELDAPIPIPHMSVVFAQRRFAGKVTDWWYQRKESATGPLSAMLSGIFLKSVSVADPKTVPPLSSTTSCRLLGLRSRAPIREKERPLDLQAD